METKMPLITLEEIELQNQYLSEKIDQLRREILIEALEPLVGRQVEVTRTFKDPADRNKKDIAVLATVVDGYFGPSEELVLDITYTHPFSGKVVKTTCAF
jgi:hypothetical protein